MKDVLIKSAVSTLLTAILMAFIGIFTGFFNEPSGSVAVTGVVASSTGTHTQTILIERWKPIVEPILVTIYGKVSKIASSNASFTVKVESEEKRTIEIYHSDLDIVVAITVDYGDKDGSVSFANLEKVGMENGFEKRSVMTRVLESTLPTILLYILFTLALQFLNYDHVRKVEKSNKARMEEAEKVRTVTLEELDRLNLRIKEHEEKLEKSGTAHKEELEKMQASLSGSRRSLTKFRIFLMLRLRDQQRELDFWYNILKEVFVSTFGRDEKESRALQELIRERLHTKGNYASLADPKAIQFYERFLKPDKEGKRPNQ